MHNTVRKWNTKGYQDITFKMECKAIIDCNPQKKTKAYKLSSTDSVKIKDRHTIRCLFPRGFPDDAIYWGIFFTSEIPQYGNIAKFRSPDLPLNKFNNKPPLGNPEVEGMICLDVAIAEADISQLVVQLKRYLQLEWKPLHEPLREGGFNDGGYDPDLRKHTLLNFDFLKKKLDEFQGVKPIRFDDKPPRKPITF